MFKAFWISCIVETVNRQPSTVNRQPSTVNRQPSTVNRQPSTVICHLSTKMNTASDYLQRSSIEKHPSQTVRLFAHFFLSCFILY